MIMPVLSNSLNYACVFDLLFHCAVTLPPASTSPGLLSSLKAPLHHPHSHCCPSHAFV
jgi:hypothetical protein